MSDVRMSQYRSCVLGLGVATVLKSVNTSETQDFPIEVIYLGTNVSNLWISETYKNNILYGTGIKRRYDD